MRIKTHWGVLLLLSLAAGLIYFNTFSAPFQFDDIPNIVTNPKIKGLFYFFDLANTRYLGFLSFALNYHIGGLDVFGYHLVNLLTHITNGFLVYVLVLLLFKACELSGERWIAITTALLFIAHPIQTQAVTYIIQRFASLATLFYLLGVVGYLKWRLSDRWGWYVVALIATVLGMKTKEFVFTLPLMILLVESLFFTKKRWAYLIPFLLTLFSIPLSRIDVLEGEKVPLFSGTPTISRLDYLFTQFGVIVTYLRLLVFPANQNVDYDYPVSHSLFAPSVFVPLLFLVALFAVAVILLLRVRRNRSSSDASLKLISFGIFWFFLTVSAESSIIPIRDVIFEHRVYLPSVGFFLSVCVALGLALRKVESPLRREKMGFLVMGGVVLIFSIATIQRNRIWGDELTLWQDVVQKSPQKARGYNALGLAYKKRGRQEDAVAAFKTALGLEPDYTEPRNNLGNIYGAKGQQEEAVEELQSVLKLQPGNPQAHNNLGNIYGAMGRQEDAIRELQIAVKLQPSLSDAHFNLGVMYAARGKQEDAIQEFKTALKLQPDDSEAHYRLGILYKDLGRTTESVASFKRALEIQPDFTQARRALDALKGLP